MLLKEAYRPSARLAAGNLQRSSMIRPALSARSVSWPCVLTALSGRWTNQGPARLPDAMRACSSTWSKS